jgi:uncharacterized protein YdeI (YjbR/CyaY-like superfamily)
MTQRSIPIGVVVNPEVSAYIERSTQWPEELAALREILLRCGLSEEIKWGKPCYSHDGSNVAILQEMKRFLALMFFKGALLQDPEGVLEEQGPNSRSARRITFSSLDDVARRAAAIEAFVAEAIAVADAGLTVGPAPELALVDELQRRIERDPAFKAAFEALTPGRQRELNLYVAGAKQSTTREARVEKHAQRILEGKGLRDR